MGFLMWNPRVLNLLYLSCSCIWQIVYFKHYGRQHRYWCLQS